jgi:hypothetical protein
MGKNFPVGRILITGIELFVLIMLNLVGFYALNTAPKVNADSPYAIIERSYDDFPSFTGVVKEIKSFDLLCIIEDAEDGTRNNEPKYFETDSVEIGVERIEFAHIKVAGRSEERWFYASNSTYVYDSICDGCGNIKITKGQTVTFVYDPNDTNTYTPVIAIKDGSSDRVRSVVLAYIFIFLIPSVAVLTFSILLMNALNKRRNEGGGSKGLIITSIVMIVVAVLFGAGSFGLRRAEQAEQARRAHRVKEHAPVIYLYSDSDEYIDVKLELNGELTSTYPLYGNDGWTVKASRDGVLTDRNGDNYRFLFWEADLDMEYDLSKGFCVRGADTEEFFDEVLPQLGLNETEVADFKAFWLPLMVKNPYNVITFQTKAYTDSAKLVLSVDPDVEIRVNMLWYATDEFVDIEPQDLSGMNPPLDKRHGTVVSEWGGGMIPKP